MLISLSVTPSLTAQTVSDSIKSTPSSTAINTKSIEEEEEDGALLNETIKYTAKDSIVFLNDSSRVILYGKANVLYGEMDITADRIEIDIKKNVIGAYGKKDSTGKLVDNPVFKDGEQTMEAEKILYNLKTKKGKIYQAMTKQGELLVIGEQIKKDSSNIIYMQNMTCIPCLEKDARTRFRAGKAKIIPNDKIVTGPMYLEIGGVPTPLGLPFGYFPNSKKQKNGILMPTFGNNASQGFNLRNAGFYWGINDKTDFIAYADIYTNGSFAIRTVNNYNILYKSVGVVNLAYNSLNVGDKDIPAQFSKQKGYSVGWQHSMDNKNNPTVRFSANVNFVKNQQFNRINAQNSAQFLQNNFQSNISFSKSFKNSSLGINATHNQSSVNNLKPVEISFPQLTYNVNRFFPFKRENAVKQNVFDKIGISYLFEARNTLKGFDSTIFRTSDFENRLAYGVRHSLPISTNFNIAKYITVTPALNFNSVMYTKTIRQNFISDNALINGGRIETDTVNGFVGGYDANFTTSLNTKVFFDYAYKKGNLKQIRHLMIPTLAYTYRPDLGADNVGFWKSVQTNSLGATTRYSIFQNSIFGGPAQGEQNALSLNLNNNIEAKLKQKTDTGITYRKVTLLQNLSASGAYNFAADSFHMSNIGLSARTVLFKNFDVVASADFDPYKRNRITGGRVNELLLENNGTLAQFNSANVAVNTSFGSDKLLALQNLRKSPDQNNSAEAGAIKKKETEEKLPWDITFNYNLSLIQNHQRAVILPTHALNWRANIQPTKFWKIGITSGFDFATQKLSYTSVNIYRDLKCWEARIDWVPFGVRKSYFLTINIKTSMLSEFKIPVQKPPVNNL
ncbi:MAG: putative LPS assembly protein LptD [Bacteroidota bacterium]